MPNAIARNILISAAVQLALGLAAQAHADTDAAEAPLEQVTVQAQADKKADSPKFTEPLLNTPQTIQIISADVFNQQGATSLTEALRNTPGVGAFYAGENGSTNTGDAVYMRGFDASSSIFVDGIRDVSSVSRDVFNIGSVEVQKGPAGTDYGRVTPAGSINMNTKEAYLGQLVSGTVSGGTDGQKRATLDLNQELAGLEGAALRLNALWQDSDVPGRDHVNNSRSGLAPSFAIGLSGATRAYLDLLYVKQDNIPDGFVPTIGLPGWSPQAGLAQLIGHPVDPDNYYGTIGNYDHDSEEMATFRVEHDFSDTLKLRNIARWGETRQNYLLTSFMGNNTNIAYTDADDLSTYTLARSLYNTKNQVNKILTDQLNLRADFSTGAVQHHVSTGLEWAREDLYAYGMATTGSQPAANLYDPSWSPAGSLAVYPNGANNHGKTDTSSAYAFDTLKFFDERLLVTGGARVDHYTTDYLANTACGGTGRTVVACPAGAAVGTPVQTVDAGTSGTLFNWKLGVVYKPVKNGSIYADYAIDQVPPGGSSFQLSTSATSLDNPDLDPEKAKTYEVGTKWDLLHSRLSVDVALFRTEVNNLINSQDLDDNGNPTQTAQQRVQGVELSVNGNITEDWTVLLGYTHMDTKVVEGADVSMDGTSNLTYVPDDAFTSWSTYRLPFGITVGGGIRYMGDLHRGTDNVANDTPVYAGGYMVADAIVSYEVTRQLSLRLNAYNLGDKQYIASINKSGFRYTPGTPRTFLFSADFRF